jgi:uncharacterized protein (TIRG00374 family)
MKPLTILKIILLSVGVSLLLRLLFVNDPEAIKSALAGVKYGHLAVAFFIYAAILLLRARKWHILMQEFKWTVSFKSFFPGYLMITLLSTITPGKMGELSAPFLFKKQAPITLSDGFGIVLMDRLIELAVLSMLALTSGLLIIHSSGADSLLPFIYGSVVILLVFISFITFLYVRHPSQEPHGKTKGLSGKINLLMASFRAIRLRTLSVIGIITLSVWLLEITSYFFVVNAFMDVSWFTIYIVLPIAVLAGILSFIPAGLGSTATVISTLLVHLDYNPEMSGITSLFATLYLTGLLLFAGLLGTLIVNMERPTSQKS